MELYVVRVNYKGGKSRYIEWCDEHWYGTTPIRPLPKYTLEQAKTVCEQMRDHYSYNMDILGENDVIVEHINWLQSKKPSKPVQTNETAPVKKSFFSLNKGLLKNSKRFGRLK